MSQRSQRLSGAVTHAMPLCSNSAGGGSSGVLIMNTGGGTGGGGEGEREHPEHGHDGSDTLHGVPPAWVCELVTNFLDLGPIAVILALSII